MKKYLPLMLLIAGLSFSTRAQYYTIADTGFAGWLSTNGYGGCMVGNQLDTVCSRSFELQVFNGILNMSGRNISSIDGIQYISWVDAQEPNTNWRYLNLTHNNFSQFPAQIHLWCDGYLTVYLDYNHIDTAILGDTYQGLNELTMSHNNMHFFNMTRAAMYNIGLLDLSFNNLDTLPDFSYAWQGGSAYNWWLIVRHNNLTQIPHGHGDYLDIGANHISTFTTNFNGYLERLVIDSNSLTSLNLSGVGYGYLHLNCAHNQITSITNLNTALSMDSFICNDNNLTTLPLYPANTGMLDCHNNPLLQCIPILPNVQQFSLNFSNTAVPCLPRLFPTCAYISTPPVTSVPTCDTSGNVFGCPQYANMAGYVYFNDTSLHLNCTRDTTERVFAHIPVNFSQAGAPLQSVTSDNNGHYSFNEISYGTYKIAVDTTYLPIAPHCPGSAYYSAVVNAQELYTNGYDFGMNCRNGFDVGSSGAAWGGFFPGHVSTVDFGAGDMSALYGMHCAAGISGAVQVSFNGPITYVGAANGSLSPTSVNGNVITWNIPDFGTLPTGAFSVNFMTNTTATLHASVCFGVNVTPLAGDVVPSNNQFSFCDVVNSSYDPNEKLVSPSGKIDTMQNWLVYTIHFQNTGTAPANNVLIADTLSPNLDPATFQVLNASGNNVTRLSTYNNIYFQGTYTNLYIVNFNFANINLPDSAVSQTASRGYVQYKVKLKHGLTPGTIIGNTASIYFDYNAPIITNSVYDTITAVPICQADTATLTHALCYGDTFYVGTNALTMPGAYQFILTNAAGCDSVVNITLSQNQQTTATFTAESPVCTGQLSHINYTGQHNSLNPVFSWNFAGGQIVSGNNTGPYKISWSQPGTKLLILNVNDNGCRAAPDTQTVVVLPVPVSVTGTDTAICSGASVTIGSPDTTGYIYSWSPIRGLDNPDTSSPTVTLTNNTGAPVRLVYTLTTTNHGCSAAADSVVITVKPVPAPGFTLPYDSVCGNIGIINLVATPAGGTFTGQGVTGSDFNTLRFYGGYDTLTYTYTDTNQCSASTSNIIFVIPFADTVGIYYVNDSFGTNTFHVGAYRAGANYTWQVISPQTGGAPQNAGTTDSFSVYCYYLGEGAEQYIGPISVRLVYSLYGCTDTSAWDTITACPVYGGVEQLNTNNLFSLYPNPADNYTAITFDAAYTGATIFVKDITGRQLYQTQLTTSPQQIPTGNLPAGVKPVNQPAYLAGGT